MESRLRNNRKILSSQAEVRIHRIHREHLQFDLSRHGDWNVARIPVLYSGIFHGDFRFHVTLANQPRDHPELVGVPMAARLGWASTGHIDRGFHFERRSHLDLGAHLRRESLHNETVDFEHDAVPDYVFTGHKEQRLGGALRGLRAAQRALRCHLDDGRPFQIQDGQKSGRARGIVDFFPTDVRLLDDQRRVARSILQHALSQHFPGADLPDCNARAAHSLTDDFCVTGDGAYHHFSLFASWLSKNPRDKNNGDEGDRAGYAANFHGALPEWPEKYKTRFKISARLTISHIPSSPRCRLRK